MAEWLRRWTRNPLGSPRAGSNPADYGNFFFFCFECAGAKRGKKPDEIGAKRGKKKKDAAGAMGVKRRKTRVTGFCFAPPPPSAGFKRYVKDKYNTGNRSSAYRERHSIQNTY